MVYEFRYTRDYFFASLKNPAAISDTTLVADAFVPLPDDLSTTKYMPLVLHDPQAGEYEVVWVTGHSSGSNTVTVVRAKEGTVARPWPGGTPVVSAPTAGRDGLASVGAVAALPSDAHVGQRAVPTEKGVVMEKTYAAGWQASLGVALPEQIGVKRGGASPPANVNMIMRAGAYSGTSHGTTGLLTVNYKVPFPNGTLGVVFSSSSGTWAGSTTVESETASGFVLKAFEVGGAPGVNKSMQGFYMAIGW